MKSGAKEENERKKIALFFSFCSDLFALSPRSERLEQAKLVVIINFD